MRGSVLRSVLLFSLCLTLMFTLVANLLPQIEGEAPVDKEIDLGTMTMDGFVTLGENIFSGKGTCTLCHNSMGRAPDILQLDMVATSQSRLEDDRYQGSASNAVDYLRESMVEPGLYVVKGFGKKGSSDTESPMPAVNKAPILLSDVEVDAVIAFMQAKDGNEVTVALPADNAMPEKAEVAPVAAAPATPVAADNAEAALVKYACTACHSVAGSSSPVGPDLNQVGDRLDHEQIRQSILEPNAVVAEGFFPGMMPANFAIKMTVSELQMIIDFLVEQKAGL
ncbi:MAG: cytochrome c [Gammaproteobacteria bacterium]|nr:cytochrome c [Gammaproteobacteria bacterium]